MYILYGHNSAEIFYGDSGDYNLSDGGEKSYFWCIDEINPIFGGKMGVAAMVAPKNTGPQDPNKKLAQWVDLLGWPLSRKPVWTPP